MSILIKGADISPDHIQCITVFPEGFAIVEEYEMLVPIKTTKCEVASVPTPHGKLKDADKLIKYIDDKYWDSPWIRSTALSIFEQEIKNAPTIIEAEKSKQ